MCFLLISDTNGKNKKNKLFIICQIILACIVHKRLGNNLGFQIWPKVIKLFHAHLD